MNELWASMLIGTTLLAGQARAGSAEVPCCAVFELRQYVMKPDRRDDLIALFDRHFLEGQDRYAMTIVGQFRNPHAPDRFVWMRGFSDMQSRHSALTEFYQSALWKEHRAAANDTMVDVSDVLLLKPAGPDTQVELGPLPKPDAPPADGGIVVVTINYLRAPAEADFLRFFAGQAVPRLRDAGATLRGQFVTESSPNTFTALPVREGENAFLWIASFPDRDAYRAYQKRLAADDTWATRIAPVIAERAVRPLEIVELFPTQRSRLRHAPDTAR